MTTVIHCSVCNVSLLPSVSSRPNRESQRSRYHESYFHTRIVSHCRRFLPPQPALLLVYCCNGSLVSKYRPGNRIRAAVGTDVTVDEPAQASSSQTSDLASEAVANDSSEISQPEAKAVPAAGARTNRPRPGRKSEMPPIKDEDLVPGASFTGKIRAIQPFGVFVDFGAFTDGLVHISRVSDSYVKDVASIFSVGQEVTVRVVQIDKDAGRISLTMRTTDEPKVQLKRDSLKNDSSRESSRKETSSRGGDRDRTPPPRASPRPSTRKEPQKSSKFVKGQILSGTVKNLTRGGAFVALPEGEEGFLPVSEESEGFDSILGNTSLQVGQEVSARVLRITRGQVTLTMKQEVKAQNTVIQGVVHVATNPFEFAFRRNKELSAFLDERETLQEHGKASDTEKAPAEMEHYSSTDLQLKEDENLTAGKETIEEENIKTEKSVEPLVFESTIRDQVEEARPEVEASFKTEINPESDSAATEFSDKTDTAYSLEDKTADSEIPQDEVIRESISDEFLAAEDGSLLVENDIAADLTVAEVDDMVKELSDPIDSETTEEAKDVTTLSETLVEETTESSTSLQVGSEAASDNMLLISDQVIDAASAEPDVSSPPSVIATDAASADLVEPPALKDSTGEIPVTDVTEEINASNANLVSDINVDDQIKEDAASAVSRADVDIGTSDESSLQIEAATELTADDQKIEADGPRGAKLSLAVEIDQESAETEESSLPESAEAQELFVRDQVTKSDATNGVVSQDDKEPNTLVSTDDVTRSENVDGISSLPSDLPADVSQDDEEPTTLLSTDEVTRSENVNGIPSLQSDPPAVVSECQPENKTTDLAQEKESALQTANEVVNGAGDTAAIGAEALTEQSGAVGGSNPKATISPSLVKQLRDETGAGMMDCKKALSESGGDIVQAQEYLRKKGLASADKRSGRATAEGRITSYVHDNRIGVLIEVNCETDFVSRGDIFKELVDDLAMQVAACPQVTYLSTEDIPEEIVNKEREIEMQKEDLLSKPEQFRSKIVDGRIKKTLEQFALLEQPYIKNDKVVIKDWIKQTIATVGENMKIRRFVRYNLGEGLEKKSQDFAAEVAAQTSARAAPTVEADKPAEVKETTAEKKPAVAISAALVKQLREETGAGMMDCKKALAESDGNLEKAQEYLRKKGLSSADKKSSRLAAEGVISSYIHDHRMGCLIEINSETDFVARNERFKELVNDLAMQVVACPQVNYVSMEDIPESIVSKEKEIEMQRDDLQKRPENIRAKIVEGRISKRLGEMVLLEQPFIKDDSKTVKDLVKETVASLGENIKVRRFVRYTLGESI